MAYEQLAPGHYYGDTAPDSPANGSVWIHSRTGNLQIFQNGWRNPGLAARNAPTVAAGTATTAGGAEGVSFGSAPAAGIYFGSGAPTIVAPKGSLYLRTDGSSTSTRLYVASVNDGTWVAVTTAS